MVDDNPNQDANRTKLNTIETFPPKNVALQHWLVDIDDIAVQH
jgi:hypothetical protein